MNFSFQRFLDSLRHYGLIRGESPSHLVQRSFLLIASNGKPQKEQTRRIGGMLDLLIGSISCLTPLLNFSRNNLDRKSFK
jgi:hypothetical protein